MKIEHILHRHFEILLIDTLKQYSYVIDSEIDSLCIALYFTLCKPTVTTWPHYSIDGIILWNSTDKNGNYL